MIACAPGARTKAAALADVTKVGAGVTASGVEALPGVEPLPPDELPPPGVEPLPGFEPPSVVEPPAVRSTPATDAFMTQLLVTPIPLGG